MTAGGDRLCVVSHCTNMRYAKGVCKSHYNQRTHRVQIESALNKFTFESFPNSVEEAKEQRRTYYLSSTKRCFNCATVARWAHSGKCMGCFPLEGPK
jgi:hypothetical protein